MRAAGVKEWAKRPGHLFADRGRPPEMRKTAGSGINIASKSTSAIDIAARSQTNKR
jgi:hypothetical protein